MLFFNLKKTFELFVCKNANFSPTRNAHTSVGIFCKQKYFAHPHATFYRLRYEGHKQINAL